MLETPLYLTVAVTTAIVLAVVTRSMTGLVTLIATSELLTALLAAVRHGPEAIIGVLDALTRLLRRSSPLPRDPVRDGDRLPGLIEVPGDAKSRPRKQHGSGRLASAALASWAWPADGLWRW